MGRDGEIGNIAVALHHDHNSRQGMPGTMPFGRASGSRSMPFYAERAVEMTKPGDHKQGFERL